MIVKLLLSELQIFDIQPKKHKISAIDSRIEHLNQEFHDEYIEDMHSDDELFDKNIEDLQFSLNQTSGVYIKNKDIGKVKMKLKSVAPGAVRQRRR